MPLVDLSLAVEDGPAPAGVRNFLRRAERRIAAFQAEGRIPAFVPSDYLQVYPVLRALAGSRLAPGDLFCEWGCGFGVVACLAAMLDFEAFGIEIEHRLVRAARHLAREFELPVRFLHGSFIPAGGEALIGPRDEFSWFTTTEDHGQGDLEVGPDDFDVIFAYPWPDEERITADLFEHYARPGAVLVTYHDGSGCRMRRKTAKPISR